MGTSSRWRDCSEGMVGKLNVAPQQTATVQLGYMMDDICQDKELLLNVMFKLKRQKVYFRQGMSLLKTAYDFTI